MACRFNFDPSPTVFKKYCLVDGHIFLSLCHLRGFDENYDLLQRKVFIKQYMDDPNAPREPPVLHFEIGYMLHCYTTAMKNRFVSRLR